MSEKERKKKIREAKLADTKSKPDTTNDKVVQTSPQESPLVVPKTSRPTSSRSSKSKDVSSKKRKESLLSTKSYSVSHPNVVMKSSETQLCSASASSISSRKSESAVHKKRKVKESSKEMDTRPPSHHTSSPSIHAESAKQMDTASTKNSTSELHKEEELNPLLSGDSNAELEGKETKVMEEVGAKVVGSTSSLTPKGKDEVDATLGDDLQKCDTELGPAADTGTTDVADDIMKTGVEAALKNTKDMADSESRNSVENLAPSESIQNEEIVAASSEVKERSSSNTSLQKETSADSTLVSEKMKQNEASLSTVSLKKDCKDFANSVSKDETEPSDVAITQNTSTETPEAATKTDSAVNTGEGTSTGNPEAATKTDSVVNSDEVTSTGSPEATTNTDSAVNPDESTSTGNPEAVDKTDSAVNPNDNTSTGSPEAAGKSDSAVNPDEVTSTGSPEAAGKSDAAVNLDEVTSTGSPEAAGKSDSAVNLDEVTSTGSPEAATITDAAVKPDNNQENSTCDTNINSQTEPGAEIVTKNETATTMDSESSGEADKTAITSTDENHAEDKSPVSEIRDENEGPCMEKESGKEDTSSTAEEIIQDVKNSLTDTEKGALPNSTTQNEVDPVSEAASKEELSNKEVTKTDDDKKVSDSSEKEIKHCAQEPESITQQTGTESQNVPSTLSSTVVGEIQAQGEAATVEQTSSSASLSQKKSENTLEESSADHQEDKPLKQNVPGEQDLSSDHQEGDKPLDNHLSEKPNESSPVTAQDSQDKVSSVTDISPESQTDAKEAQSPASNSEDTRPQESAQLPESSNLTNQESQHKIEVSEGSLPEKITEDKTEPNSNVVEQLDHGNTLSDEDLPSTSEKPGNIPEKPSESEPTQYPQDKKDAQGSQEEHPSVSNATESELQPSSMQKQEQSSNVEPQMLSPEQSVQESISEEISSSSQDEASSAKNEGSKPQPLGTAQTSDLDSSVTEVEESEALTPVTDDLDTSRDTTLDTDGPQTQQTKESQPAETEASHMQGEINDSKVSTGRDTKEDVVDQLSDISSIITATRYLNIQFI